MTNSVPPPPPDVVESADAFLRVLKLSHLVEASRLGDVREALAPWRAADGVMPPACIQALVDRKLLTEWHIDRLLHRKSRGFFLGKCKLLQPLGHGGMGSVYLAEHMTLRSRVAVKVLPGTRADKKGSYLERFEQEARAAFGLNHPNVARAFDLDKTDDGNHFIVLEYIDGIDLDKRVRSEGPLPARDAADAIRQAAVGLQYAHEEGFVHRDIKPANLMVDKRGHLKILDLGLVQTDTRDRQDEVSITQLHEEKVMGTPDYMSPEQAQGKRVDARSDVYSLGCTLYYLLSGQAPFEKYTGEGIGINKRQARMRAHIKEPAPNVLDVRQDVPTEIVELMLRMMEKAPEARPQSAQEVADSLAAWLAAAAAQGTRTPPRRAAVRSSREDAAAGPPRRRTAAGSGSSASSSSPQDSGAGSGSEPGDFGGSSAKSGSLESDIHAVPHGIGTSDTLKPAISDLSTDRLTAVTTPGRPPEAAGGGITVDTGLDVGSPRAAVGRSPTVAAVPPARATASPRSPAAAPWLSRRVVGMPLAAWLAMAAAVVVGAGSVAMLWPAGEAEEAVEAAADEVGPPEKAARPPTPAKQSPAADGRPAKPKPAASRPKTPKKPAASADGPSALDRMFEPRPAATDAPASGN